MAALWAITALNQSKFLESFSYIPEILPKFFIIGNQDNFSSISSWKDNVVEKVPGDKMAVIIDKVDHFWHGCENLIVKEIHNWLLTKL